MYRDDGVNSDAQRLNNDIINLDFELVTKFKETFWTAERRDMIMTLPTTEGRKVFTAVRQLASCAKNANELGQELIKMCTDKWKALCHRIMHVTDPQGYLMGTQLWCQVPTRIADIPAWYEQMYHDDVTVPSAERHNAVTELDIHRGYAWRTRQTKMDTGTKSAVNNEGVLYPPGTNGADEVEPAGNRHGHPDTWDGGAK
jgi:hypothetical protein